MYGLAEFEFIFASFFAAIEFYYNCSTYKESGNFEQMLQNCSMVIKEKKLHIKFHKYLKRHAWREAAREGQKNVAKVLMFSMVSWYYDVIFTYKSHKHHCRRISFKLCLWFYSENLYSISHNMRRGKLLWNFYIYYVALRRHSWKAIITFLSKSKASWKGGNGNCRKRFIRACL